MSAVSKENQDEENSTSTDTAKNRGGPGETVNDPADGSSQKKKYGKFRALRSNQQQRLTDEQSNDGHQPTVNCNRTEDEHVQQPPPKTAEQFIPPTLLANSEEVKNEKNDETSEETADEKPKKGKTVRKKDGGRKVQRLNLDEIDDSNSPLRRRSSRLKVLEEKKESSANSEPTNNRDEVQSSESDKRPEAITVDTVTDNAAESNDTSAKQPDEQLDHRSDQTPKDKKKDKRKKDKKRSKKHDKRRSSRRKSSKDEDSDEDEMDADPDKPNSSDCFTSPSTLAAGPNASDGALKPEKVKSRWRRNSELETGNEPAGGKKDALTSSENLIHNNVNSSNNSFQVSPSLPSSGSVAVANDENTEPMPEFEKIPDNIYRFEKKITKFTKEVKKMVCDCILTKEERARGLMGCGEDCLNRMLMIECGSKCPLENHCANKRFLRQQYSKVEAFKTAKKGWGLRAQQALQPNQFIMEYVGEVIGPDEFSTRVRRFAKEGRKHHFFMALKGDEIIDATYRGNITRFVNHSCDPNAETQKWTVNGDLRIGFFAKKSIQPGEEITFNYQFQRYGREAQPCYCESENCRGFIGATDVSDEVDIELEDESESEVCSAKKVKPVKSAVDKLKEEFEDLALEEEIDKLKSNGGLQNRQQTLMLARLMVRAEDKQSRFKLLDIIRQTKEHACIRLLLDYHALQLLWSWMVDQEDVFLKAEIISGLEFLQIPNKTILKDSKVLEVIERWALDKSADAKATVEGRKSIDAKGASNEPKNEEVKKLTNGDLLSETAHAKLDSALDDKKLDASSTDESTLSIGADSKSSSHLKNYHIIKKEAKSAADPTQVAKSVPSIAMMAARLLNLWKDLKEVYRIPRLERQKRHEDEKEADRKAMENEAELNARLNNTASFLRRGAKRSLDGAGPVRQFGYSNHKQHNSHHPAAAEQGTVNKISKEEHRTYYNVELMRKDYEEAMKQYKKQIEQYNIAIQQQLNSMNGAIPMPIQPPMPPAPPNVGSLFQPAAAAAGTQQPSQSSVTNQSPSFPNSYNSSNLYSSSTSDKQVNDFKAEHTPVFSANEHYPQETDHAGQSNQVAYTQQHPELVTYNHLYQYGQQSTEIAAASTDVCMEPNESQLETTTELEKSWNTVYSELTGGLRSNTIVCTSEQHAFSEGVLQSDYHFVAENVGSVSELFGDIYPRPGTYLVSDGRTFFMPCNSNGCQPEEMVVECNFDLPSQQLTKRPLPENWKYAKAPNGNYYYYNKTTSQVQWSAPFDRSELQNANSTAATGLASVNSADQNVVVSSAADSTSTPKFDTSSIDASKINLATLNEILMMSNGLAPVGDSDPDPRKRLKLEDDSQEQLNNALSLELENKIVKFPTYQQAKAERRKNTKERLKEIKETKERFKAELSEHIKSVLNQYRQHDCKIGKILCDDDFKQVARRLTHEVFGKELQKKKKDPENLQLTAGVKQKSKEFVQKYMTKSQAPFYKPPEERSGEEDEEEPRDDKRRRLLLHSPVFHQYQTASNSASNSLDTTPRVDTTPKVDHQTAPISPKAPLDAFDDASPATVETAATGTLPEATPETISKTLSAADLAASITAYCETVVKCEREIVVSDEMAIETVAEPATTTIDSEVSGSHLNDQPVIAHQVEQGEG